MAVTVEDEFAEASDVELDQHILDVTGNEFLEDELREVR